MKNSKPKNYKHERISSEIKRIIEEVVSFEIKDPRVCGNVSVTDVIVSSDFSSCKVFIYSEKDVKDDALKGLKNSAGFVRHVLAEQLDMRKTPDVFFVFDDTIDNAKRIEELLQKIK